MAKQHSPGLACTRAWDSFGAGLSEIISRADWKRSISVTMMPELSLLALSVAA